MKRRFFSIHLAIGISFSALSANALVGMDEMTQNLYQKNQEISALEKDVESKEASTQSSNSAYYPTLNAVGGYGQNKTDDFATPQKGYMGYLEGKLNLFRGFKDQAVGHQREIEVQISKLDLESKKRELRKDLTEAASSMVYLHKLQNILEEEYKITQTQRQMAAKKVAAGLTGSVDSLEFDLREDEIQIVQKQINQEHEAAHQKLAELYGESVSDSSLEKIDFSSLDNLAKLSEQISIENTIDFKKAQLIQLHSEFEKKEIKSDYLPSLDLTYSAGRLTPSEDAPVKFNESRYAIQLTIPLFSGFDTFYKTKAASLSVQSSEMLKMQRVSEVKADLNILKTKASELSALFQINEKKLINSKKYFDLTLAEYRRGTKNSPDLVSATERLFSSKKKKYEILKELEIIKVKFENYN